MEAYTSTTVNSDIFFQCQQPGFVPSYRSATCGSNGRWSPDPSQVECRMVIPTEPIPTRTTVPTSAPVLTGTVIVHRHLAYWLVMYLDVHQFGNQSAAANTTPNKQQT